MRNYSVSIRVDQRWVEDFARNGFRLLTAFGVEANGRTQYDVVAAAFGIGERINVSWEDRFAIAASNDRFSEGVRFDVSTNYTDIAYGQKYVLQADFADGRTSPDAHAPRDGFAFENEPIASIVLARRVDGKQTAIYFDSVGPLPPGRTELIPKPSVRLWFAREEEGTLISDIRGRFIELDLSGRTNLDVQYDGSGNWVQL